MSTPGATLVSLFLYIIGSSRWFDSLSSCSTGKYKRGSLAEEEQCEDLLLFMKMLYNLTTKDFLDFGGVDDSEVGVASVDVVISGVSIILPLMNEELLKVYTVIL